MNEDYRILIQDAKKHYADSCSHVTRIKNGKQELVECPKWYDLDFGEKDTEELNLWNYWQGLEVDHPTLMIVGQDWGRIDRSNRCSENIRAIAKDSKTNAQYLSGCDTKESESPTDRMLIDIFEKHLDRKLREIRYPDLYFTNLCLGYRQDNTSGYFRQSWLTEDARLFFKRLVDIKCPKVIVCLGRATSETAYKALTGKKLAMPDGFYSYIDSPDNGKSIPGYDDTRFFVMAHPGGMGAANRKSENGGGHDVIDDWSFLPQYLPKDPLPVQ